ncbi:hypothetical protein KDA_51730 [Dictyobacter alpinus]|uniref:Uncharacterized protein n=1 Tax=Dictyobacter alpinus TaxID=2014873 RepID=A0A402BED8_9CHLR|nr:hypothetical protein [Dictyobacter alpinus]GCE29689.1 hypothetical protein KDA_51730 [Dictyobacter alpinus]
MAFYDDIDGEEEVLRNPIWSSFTLAKNNIEVLIAINLVWAITLLPVLVALGFGTWPLWLRLPLLGIGVVALAASSGVVFGLVAKICGGEPLTMGLLQETIRGCALDSIRRLAPLYGIFGAGFLVIGLTALTHISIVEILVQFVLLWLLFCSLYWGPLFADLPAATSWTLLSTSLRLILRSPAQSLRTAFIVLALVILGVVSLAGILLIVPVLVALIQTYQYRQLVAHHRNHFVIAG